MNIQSRKRSALSNRRTGPATAESECAQRPGFSAIFTESFRYREPDRRVGGGRGADIQHSPVASVLSGLYRLAGRLGRRGFRLGTLSEWICRLELAALPPKAEIVGGRAGY